MIDIGKRGGGVEFVICYVYEWGIYGFCMVGKRWEGCILFYCGGGIT